MGMVACDDKLPVAPPQANEQGPVLDGFDGASASLVTTTVDLKAAFESGNEYVSIYSVNAGSSGIAQADIWGQLEISNSADFGKSIVLSEYNGMVGTVSLDELNEAHMQLFGVSPYDQTVYYRIPLFATVEGNDYRIGSPTSYGASGTYIENNYDPGFEIQETYYIIGVEGWDPMTDCVKLSHGEQSAYDDPNFYYEFESEGTTYWKIVPPDVYNQLGDPSFDAGSDFWPNIYSVYKGDSEYSGTLEIADGPSGEIPAGTWTITVNMKNLTYEVTGTPAGLPDWIGTPNDSQGWDIASSMKLMPNGDNYMGFSYFGGTWGGKLAYSMGGNDIWLGQDGEAVSNGSDTDPMWTIPLSEAGGNIFEGEDAQMYFISYNFAGKTAYFHKILTCSIIGGFNDWGGDEPLTAVEGSDDMKWTINYTFGADTEFKFRFNGSWDINLGGDLNDLQFNGDNISVAAGTYEISLDITNVPYTATITAK